MVKKKILVLTDTMPWGHRSIAKAIFGYLKSISKEENWDVNYAEVKPQYDILNDMYVAIYRFMPSAGALAQKAMENNLARKKFLELLDYDLPGLKKVVSYYKPDLIISSYFTHSHCLAKWRESENLKFKLWTVAADPWTINPVSFVEKADLHLVYDEKVEKLGMKCGIRKENIFKTGWWVRQEMYDEKYKSLKTRIEVRKKLGFGDDRTVVFVGGGSLGTSAVSKLLPVLMMVKKPVGIILNTGTDKLAYSMAEEYIKLLKKIRKDNLVIIKNMGWIENMAEVLSACDIVFGKAGPNFLFDVMAVGKPFVAICHIAGQEDGNINLIRKKNLGWVKERGREGAEFLLKYLDNPEKYLTKYQKSIDQEAFNNNQAMIKIRERIKKDIPSKAELQ